MKRSLFIWAVMPALVCITGPVRAGDTTTNVLFIGNSYTYYHSMPQLFRAMAGHRFPDHQVVVKFVGRGGATLQQQWEEGRALKEIQSGSWDYVVLQEQSMLGGEITVDGRSHVRDPDRFFAYAEKFAKAIEEQNSETVFFMTWAWKAYPHHQKYLTYAYMEIARKTGSKIVPVGMVWDSLRNESLFDLYERDGSHPSIYGSYTAALTLFSIIFDIDPGEAEVPGRLVGHKILEGGNLSPESTELCNLDQREAETIRSAVSGLTRRLRSGNGYLAVEKAISDKRPDRFSEVVGYLGDARGQFVVFVIISIAILYLGRRS